MFGCKGTSGRGHDVAGIDCEECVVVTVAVDSLESLFGTRGMAGDMAGVLCPCCPKYRM